MRLNVYGYRLYPTMFSLAGCAQVVYPEDTRLESQKRMNTIESLTGRNRTGILDLCRECQSRMHDRVFAFTNLCRITVYLQHPKCRKEFLATKHGN
jgi:hypothetical protein